MKNSNIFAACASVFLLSLTACNGGLNLTVPGTLTPEGAGVENGGTNPTPTPNPSATPDPSATPNPSPSPSPTPNTKNRIFVLNATLKPINTQSQGFFNYACYREAMRNRIKGKFVALVAASDKAFTSKYKVSGYIYQKLYNVENRVADSIQQLFNGNNESITALAWQWPIDTSYEQYVWTGQRNMNLPANTAENCNDWTGNTGESIMGLIGARGSDALSKKMQSCNVFSHLYCIQIDD